MAIKVLNNDKIAQFVNLEGIDKFMHLIANWFNWAAMLGFAMMTIITVIDVIGLKFFQFPFAGGYEVTSLVAVVIAPKVPMGTIFKGIASFVVTITACLVIIMFVPQIATSLPQFMTY